MKLNRHDYELIILGLSYLQLHLQKQYEIGAFKTFTLCKECEKQLINVSKVDTVKKVISIDNNIYY